MKNAEMYWYQYRENVCSMHHVDKMKQRGQKAVDEWDKCSGPVAVRA
jgi:hypothetical protein